MKAGAAHLGIGIKASLTRLKLQQMGHRRTSVCAALQRPMQIGSLTLVPARQVATKEQDYANPAWKAQAATVMQVKPISLQQAAETSTRQAGQSKT